MFFRNHSPKKHPCFFSESRIGHVLFRNHTPKKQSCFFQNPKTFMLFPRIIVKAKTCMIFPESKKHSCFSGIIVKAIIVKEGGVPPGAGPPSASIAVGEFKGRRSGVPEPSACVRERESLDSAFAESRKPGSVLTEEPFGPRACRVGTRVQVRVDVLPPLRCRSGGVTPNWHR